MSRKANPIKQAEKAEAQKEQFNRLLEVARKYDIEMARFMLHENSAKIRELKNHNRAIRTIFPSFSKVAIA